VAVADPQAVGVIPPAAAANRPLMGLAGEPVRGPFPDIPGHILDSEWRNTRREPADGCGFNIAVRPIGAATTHAAEIGAEGRRLPGWVVSPLIAPSVGAAGRKLPLRFGRQTQSVPAAIGPGIIGETWTTG